MNNKIRQGGSVPVIGAGMYAWLDILAAAAMALSSVKVVGNSLLFERYKPKFAITKKKTEKLYFNRDLKEAYIPQKSSTNI